MQFPLDKLPHLRILVKSDHRTLVMAQAQLMQMMITHLADLALSQPDLQENL
jgi:hypothetical protein